MNLTLWQKADTIHNHSGLELGIQPALYSGQLVE